MKKITLYRVSPKQPDFQPDFRSYDRAMWRDTSGQEHKQYVVRPMQDGSGGFAIVETENDANYVTERDFKTAQDAQTFMQKHRAPK
jgi:hypothetical protein